MRLNAIIAGVGMTHFGKHMETGLKAIGAEAVKSAIADAGIDPQQLIDDYVDLFNGAIGGRPAQVAAAIHLCRGNY